MRLAKGVVAGFGGPEAARPPAARQLALLQQLAALLDRVEQGLAGCHVLLGGHTGIDAGGTLWLDAGDPDGCAARWHPHSPAGCPADGAAASRCAAPGPLPPAPPLAAAPWQRQGPRP
jgi:hypothetical protein